MIRPSRAACSTVHVFLRGPATLCCRLPGRCELGHLGRPHLPVLPHIYTQLSPGTLLQGTRLIAQRFRGHKQLFLCICAALYRACGVERIEVACMVSPEAFIWICAQGDANSPRRVIVAHLCIMYAPCCNMTCCACRFSARGGGPHLCCSSPLRRRTWGFRSGMAAAPCVTRVTLCPSLHQPTQP